MVNLLENGRKDFTTGEFLAYPTAWQRHRPDNTGLFDGFEAFLTTSGAPRRELEGVIHPVILEYVTRPRAEQTWIPPEGLRFYGPAYSIPELNYLTVLRALRDGCLAPVDVRSLSSKGYNIRPPAERGQGADTFIASNYDGGLAREMQTTENWVRSEARCLGMSCASMRRRCWRFSR